MKSVVMCGVAFAALCSSASLAQELRFTASEGYANYSVGEVDAHAMSSRLAFSFNEYLSVEGQFDTGLSGSTSISCPVNLDCTGLEPRARFRSAIGAHVVGRMPVSEQFSVFGRVGYVRADIKADVGPSGSDESISYGIGSDWYFNDEHGVRFEYSRADYDDFGSADVWGVAYIRRF